MSEGWIDVQPVDLEGFVGMDPEMFFRSLVRPSLQRSDVLLNDVDEDAQKSSYDERSLDSVYHCFVVLSFSQRNRHGYRYWVRLKCLLLAGFVVLSPQPLFCPQRRPKYLDDGSWA